MVSFINKVLDMFVKKNVLDDVPAEHVEEQPSEMNAEPAAKSLQDNNQTINKLQPKVNITGINLKFMGGSHQIKGMEIIGDTFDLRIPFNNKMGNDTLPENLKGPKMVLNRITVDPPFSIEGVDPKLPVEIEYMSKVVFILKIRAPKMNWEGPMNVNFGNEPANNVTISIRKVTLHRGDKAVELEESGVTSSMQKSQLFRQNVQLYKIISFDEEVKNIEVSAPFQLVSTEPALPIKADKTDSYIVSLYMKCPESSYAGDLDIKFL